MSDVTADQTGLIVPCGSCGQRNRLAFGRLGLENRCPKCKTPIPAPASPVDIPNAAIFDALIASSAVPVLVDFWASWCGPCHMVAPEVKKVAASEAGRLVVVKVNTEEVRELSARFRIRSIPTMVLFAKGREIAQESGARPAEGILAFVSQSLMRA